MIFVFEIRIRIFQISRFDSRFVFDISNLRFGFEIRIRIFQISRFDSRFGFDIWNLRFGFDIRIRVMRILYSSWKFARISNIYIRIFVEYKYSPTFGGDPNFFRFSGKNVRKTISALRIDHTPLGTLLYIAIKKCPVSGTFCPESQYYNISLNPRKKVTTTCVTSNNSANKNDMTKVKKWE